MKHATAAVRKPRGASRCRHLLGALAVFVLLPGALLQLPAAAAQTDSQPPDFDDDVAVLAGPDGVVSAAEGSPLVFGVYLARAAPIEVIVVLELLFGGPSVEGSAVIRDLANDGSIITSPNAKRYFVEVPIDVGSRGGNVEVLTAKDRIADEGVDGIEHFRVSIADVRGPRGTLSYSADLELAIEDATPERTRVRSQPAPPPPTPEPIIGPLVAASVGYSVDARTVTLHVPAALRVWLAQNGTVRVLRGDDVLTTAPGTPATMSFELPEKASPPFVVTLQGRLRSGAEYREDIAVIRPSTD